MLSSGLFHSAWCSLKEHFCAPVWDCALGCGLGAPPSWGLSVIVSIPAPAPTVPGSPRCLLPVLSPPSLSRPCPLLSHLSHLPTSHPSPALFLRDLRSFPSPVTVQEIPGSAVPEAGGGPEGEALCQRAVQGQKGFIRPEVRPSQALRCFVKQREASPGRTMLEPSHVSMHRSHPVGWITARRLCALLRVSDLGGLGRGGEFAFLTGF